MKFILLAPACALAAIGCSSDSVGRIQHELGNVEPGQNLYASIAVHNPYDRSAMMTGLDNACGVRIIDSHNGILQPNEDLRLKVTSRAPQIAGPGAFKLELGLESGLKKSTTTHLFTYTVRAHKYIDRTQVWFDDSHPASVRVIGLDTGEQITAVHPEGVKAVMIGDTVQFSGSQRTSRYPIPLSINISTPAGLTSSFPLDGFPMFDARVPRLYPDVVWVSASGSTTTIVNASEHLQVTVTPINLVTVRREGPVIHLTALPLATGMGTLELRDQSGRALSSAKIFLAGDQRKSR